MNKIVSIDGANINAQEFSEYNKQAQEALRLEQEAMEEFEGICTVVSKNTGIKKPKVKAYFKARFKDDTDKTIEKGALFEALDSALEG